MLNKVSNQPQETSWELPQDIIDACKIIWDKASKAADPTRISHIWEVNDEKYCIWWGQEVQHFISLLTRWILPVCEVFEENWIFYSIAMNHSEIKERISIPEAVADLVLLHILTDSHQLIDRSFYDTLEWKQENFIYDKWSLSIYDLEIEIGDTKIYDSWSITKAILKHITRIKWWSEESHEFKKLMRCKNNQTLFKQRFLKKINLFLEQYDSEDGKTFFLNILIKSWAEEEYEDSELSGEELYKIFIGNLKILQEFFE